MSVTARLTVPARRDLIQQYVYLGDIDLDIADHFLDAAFKAIDRLTEMPESGALREFANTRLSGTRLWPIPQHREFLIFYQFIGSEIRILRILHSAQDYRRVLGEDPS